MSWNTKTIHRMWKDWIERKEIYEITWWRIVTSKTMDLLENIKTDSKEVLDEEYSIFWNLNNDEKKLIDSLDKDFLEKLKWVLLFEDNIVVFNLNWKNIIIWKKDYKEFKEEYFSGKLNKFQSSYKRRFCSYELKQRNLNLVSLLDLKTIYDFIWDNNVTKKILNLTEPYYWVKWEDWNYVIDSRDCSIYTATNSQFFHIRLWY